MFFLKSLYYHLSSIVIQDNEKYPTEARPGTSRCSTQVQKFTFILYAISTLLNTRIL